MSELEVSVTETVDAVNENQWNNLVEQSAMGSVFHRHEWLRAVERGRDYDPKHLVVSKKGNPIAVFPNFVRPLDTPFDPRTPVGTIVDKLPFDELISTSPGYGGPVIMTDEEACIDRLLPALESVCGRDIVAHTLKIDHLGFIRYGAQFERAGYDSQLLTCRFVLDLTKGWDRIEAEMHRSRRQALTRAHKNDVEVVDIEIDTEALRETYRAYERNIERVDGSLDPFSFFETLGRHVDDRMKIFAATVDGREIGRYVYFLDDERSTIIHYYPAIADEADFEFYPSELLHEHAIRWGIEHGYETYDFGGSGANFRDGPFRYKAKYGARAVPTLIWEKRIAPVRMSGYQIARDVYRKMTV